MKQPIPLYSLLLSIVVALGTGLGVWVSTREEITALSKTQDFQQRQIDELRSINNEMKSTVKMIENSLSDIKGDVKVLVSKVK